MDAAGRARPRKWQLSWTPDRACKFVARRFHRFAGEFGVWTDVLDESAGTKRTRSRHGTNARFAMAKRGMASGVHLQRRACGHGGGARFALRASFCRTVIESDYCPTRFRRKVFRCAVPGPGSRSGAMKWESLTCLL